MRPVCVVLGDSYLTDEVTMEFGMAFSGFMEVLTFPKTRDLVRAIQEDPRIRVPVLGVTAVDGPLDEALALIRSHAQFQRTRTLLVTDNMALTDINESVDAGMIHAVITEPWRPGVLGQQALTEATHYMRAYYPAHPTTRHLETVYRDGTSARISRLLRFLESDAEAMVARIIKGIDTVLGPRPRITLPAGTRLTRQGYAVDALFVALDGKVALERRTDQGTFVMHHATTGPLVGILSFAQQHTAFFTSRATTDVTAIHLTLEQADLVFNEDPVVSAAMAATAIRSLDRRLRRSEQLQVEKIQLAEELEAERAHLATALAQLESARLTLVAHERFATLGQLSAGVAHELNNPVAAMQRSMEHLERDIAKLVASHEHSDFVSSALERARHRPPMSTADERASRRAITEQIGDPALAHQLVAAGVTDPQEAAALYNSGPTTLELLEASAGIGASLRNLDGASSRIRRLVASLKSYARPDNEPIDGVDVNECIEDTLRLTKYRLREIEVETIYGDIPLIRAHPGQLDQVWTNILVNSADALGGSGKITIETKWSERIRPDGDIDYTVDVIMRDNGPGIPPETLPRIFEPRFTTKSGQVRFGLGMGLSVVKSIVEHHGGTIEMTSEPGCTQTTVVLPVEGRVEKEKGT